MRELAFQGHKETMVNEAIQKLGCYHIMLSVVVGGVCQATCSLPERDTETVAWHLF